MAVPKLWFLEMWAQMSQITNQTRDFSKGSGSTNVCQELLRSTHRWLMNAEFCLLTFKIRIQMPLLLNISIAIYPGKCVSTVGCTKTLESVCLKSSIGQLLMWTSGLLFSEEKMADYSLSSCMQHTQEWNSFQERRRQRGIVQLWWKCYAATSLNIWPCAATPLFHPILLKCKCSQTHWHTKQSFSKSQYPDEA